MTSPPISLFSRLCVLFLFLAAAIFTVGAIYRDRLDDQLIWIAVLFLTLTLAAFVRAMIQPRTTTLLISWGLSLGMIVFSAMVFLHI